MIYLLSSDAPELPMPFKTYIAMSRFNYSEPAIFDVRSFKTNGHEVSVWYANNSMYPPEYKLAHPDKFTNMKPSWVAGKSRNNYNIMGGAVYGDSATKFDFRQYASYRESYNGVPLFQISCFSVLTRKFTRAEIQDKFRGATQVRVRLVMKVTYAQRFTFVVESKLYNNSDQEIGKSGYSSNYGPGTLTTGYYDIYMRMDLTNVNWWDYLKLTIAHNGGDLGNLLFSEFLFYDNEDGQILPPPIYDSVRLISGSTAERPYLPIAGQLYFDTTLHKQIVYNGSAWVNVDGTSL